MAGSNDFTGQNIQDTYQRVLQLSSSGELADGTGSLVPLLIITASHAISASHEITFELSSSHAQTAGTASFANNFTASGNISASGIGFFSQILVDGQSALDTLDTTGRVFGDSDITKVEIGKTFTTTSTVIEGNITASDNISASGNIIANSYSGKINASDTNEDITIFPLMSTGQNAAPNISNGISFNPSSDVLTIGGSQISIGQGHVTASGNISASGNIIANNITSDLTGSFKKVHILESAHGPADNSSNPRLIVGRFSTQEHIQLSVTDGHCIIQANQDSDSNADHEFRLDRVFAGTGANNFIIQKNGSAQFIIDKNAHITASGDISASGGIEALTFTSPTLDVTDGSAQITENIPLTFGDLVSGHTGKLNIKHDGTDGTISSNTGDLTINNTSGDTIIANQGSSGKIILAPNETPGPNTNSGQVLISGTSGNDGVPPHLMVEGEITASGNISSSGDIIATGTGSFARLEATSNIALQVSNSQQIVFENTAGTEFGNIQMNTSDNMLFQNLRSNKDVIIRAGNSSNEGHFIIQPGGDTSTNIAKFGKTADLNLLGNFTSSGNISASGRIYGRQFEQIETNFGYDFDSGTFVYMPFSNQSITENAASTNLNINRVAVVPGKPIKSIIRATGNTLGNNTPYTMSYWEAAEGDSTTPVLKAAVYADTDSSSNKDAIRFDWSSPNSGSTTDVAEGSRIYMSLESNNSNNAGYIVTHLWEWDYNSI